MVNRLLCGFLLLFMVTAGLSACSSGGGGDDSPPPLAIRYTGNTAPAQLSDLNATGLLTDAYFGLDVMLALLEDPPLAAGGVAVLSSATDPTRRILVDQPKRLASDLIRRQPAERLEDVEHGACGGTLTLLVDVNTQTGAFSGSETYDDFDDCQAEYDGRLDISGRVDPLGLFMISLDVRSTLLRVSQADATISLAGSLSVRYGAPILTRFDMLIRDDASGLVYRYADYQLEVAADAFQTTTISGSYYDPIEGLLQLSTDMAMAYFEGWPESGILRGQGADGASVRLLAINRVLYRSAAVHGSTAAGSPTLPRPTPSSTSAARPRSAGRVVTSTAIL